MYANSGGVGCDELFLLAWHVANKGTAGGSSYEVLPFI